MAARAIGTSTIAFGLVSLPVKIYSTSESSRKVSFNMIWKERGVRVRQQYIDPADGAVVPKEEIVKGYEFAKDQYVLFTPEELEVVETPKTDEIEIVSFVPADTVGRLYFNKAYYLGPDKGGARAYRLLAAALRDTDRVAIAKHATRGKQYIVMVRPHEEGLLMEQLYYADEIRSFDEVPLEEGEVNKAELQLAKQLIDQAAADAFDPTQFQDEVREKTLELIEQKIAGQEITAAPAEESKTKIIDLMAALKASIEADEDEDRKPASRAGRKTEGAEEPAAKKRSGRRKAASG
jgi:DNA end-binding protein Ku